MSVCRLCGVVPVSALLDALAQLRLSHVGRIKCWPKAGKLCSLISVDHLGSWPVKTNFNEYVICSVCVHAFTHVSYLLVGEIHTESASFVCPLACVTEWNSHRLLI